MRKMLFAAATTVCIVFMALGSPRGADPEAGKAGARLVASSTALISSLTPAQREKALFKFDDPERFNWHFIPRARKGVPLKELDESQRAKARALLDAGLSAVGSKRASDVMSLDEVLRQLEGPSGRITRDPLLYYLSFFGEPGKGRWGARVEGHHLSLNWSLDGEQVLSSTPLMYGANPALVRDGPRKGERVLAGVEDAARELVTSLSPDELKACRGEGESAVPPEVPGTETAKYAGALPPGIAARDLKETSRALLAKLLSEYTRNLAPEVEEAVKKEIGADLKDVHFAWRGGTKSGEGHSYLVHGPTFVINYTNTQNDAFHVHCAFRDLTGEWGEGGR
jgi:hypothetical protein